MVPPWESTSWPVHRLDATCDQTDFTSPPVGVQAKFLRPLNPEGHWTLLVRCAAGDAEPVAAWLRMHGFLERVSAAPGLAPRLVRAMAPSLPPHWSDAHSHVDVLHINLMPTGRASWYVRALPEALSTWMMGLSRRATDPPLDMRSRPVDAGVDASVCSRRQFNALALAVSMGYYEVPHRVTLRDLAGEEQVGVSSIAELLRRAESAVLTHFVDRQLQAWPASMQWPAHSDRTEPRPSA